MVSYYDSDSLPSVPREFGSIALSVDSSSVVDRLECYTSGQLLYEIELDAVEPLT